MASSVPQVEEALDGAASDWSDEEALPPVRQGPVEIRRRFPGPPLDPAGYLAHERGYRHWPYGTWEAGRRVHQEARVEEQMRAEQLCPPSAYAQAEYEGHMWFAEWPVRRRRHNEPAWLRSKVALYTAADQTDRWGAETANLYRLVRECRAIFPLIAVLEDDVLAERYVAAGAAAVRRYDWSVVASQILRVYETVAATGAKVEVAG